jgi:glycosyltransferase involved in cell wall biosynthesis
MRPRVALLPWGDVFEDWLDPLGITLETFRDEFAGSWMFGYVDALRTAGVESTIVCVTSRVDAPVTWPHGPTGATLHLLPPGPFFPPVSRAMLREPVAGRRDPGTLAGAALRHVAPYLATPIVRLVRLLRAERCDAILCQEYETPRFDACILAGKITRKPVFATFQGGDYQDSRLERLVRPWTMRLAQGLIVGTGTEIERVCERYGVPRERITQIFNPVDADLWRPDGPGAARPASSKEAVTAVWHGQLQMHRKGLDLLLDAWAEIIRARPGRKLELKLIGRGVDAAVLRGRIAEQGLASVHLVDEWVTDRARIAEHLRGGDVYVFPSRHEGFPVAPVEAMACGLPVVAAAAQGIGDIFAQGPAHGGIVVPRGDSRALAVALGGLLDDEELRHTLGRRARERVLSAFSPATVGRELRRVLLRETQ